MIKLGLIELIGVLFVALKLMGLIGWSWWLVTLPLWVAPALIVLFIILAVLIAIMAAGTGS